MLKLLKCDYKKCEGMCCYDGVYLLPKKEELINKIVAYKKDFFTFLPKNYIIDGNWKNIVKGRKTNVKPFDYKNKKFPKHFEKTKCVFALENNDCSLQVIAEKLKVHKWTFKPSSCWLFPLRINNYNELQIPPIKKKDDPYYVDDSYLGFVSYTLCGKYSKKGQKWNIILKDEINYFKKHGRLPVWLNPSLNIKDALKMAKI